MISMATQVLPMGLSRLIWWLILAIFFCSSAPSLAHAYSVKYVSLYAEDVGAKDFDSAGLCHVRDPASHTMMPKTESFHALAHECYKTAGFVGLVPIGGSARQAACLDSNCTWQFNHGLYLHNELTFFRGVIYKGVDKTKEVDGVYNNFRRSVSPVWWENVSYWGKRQTCMGANGSWGNIEISHLFREWICEYYEYDKSDHVFFPTYPDGDPIVPPADGKTYTHCGKPIKFDAQIRWIYQRCIEPPVWYVELCITLGITIAVFVLIILVIIVIRCVRRRRKEQKMEKLLTTGLENPARIPTQSQINMAGSMFINDMDQ